MLRLTDEFPDQLRLGLERSKAASFTVETGRSPFVVGMGGSGIAGDLLSTLGSSTGRIPVVPVRSFDVPSWAGRGTPAVFVSYSGDTPETLLAYDRSTKLGLNRVVVTSGGALLQKAQADGVPSVVVPGGNPPRASLGYLFGALYGLLGSLFEGGERSLVDSVEELRGIGPALKATGGPADRVARGWGKRDLWVYVPERLAPVGRRWMTQAAENAKRLAHFDTLTEALHNAVVPWDLVTREEAVSRCVVLVTGRAEGELQRSRTHYLVEVWERAGVVPVRIELSTTNPLTELLEGVWVGDYASVREAALTGVDPIPVPALERMKARKDT